VRTTYRMLAYVIAATVALQAASVALAFFTILDEVDGGQIITADYDYEGNLGILVHRVGGLGIIPLAAIALLIVSFFSKGAGAVRWAGTVFGLVVLQIAFVFAAFGGAPSAGALHGLNALAMFLAALWAGRRIARVPELDEQELDAAAA